jgi:hypothetical protein
MYNLSGLVDSLGDSKLTAESGYMATVWLVRGIRNCK